MKKIIYTFVILFVAQLSFANEVDSILSQAREFGKERNYAEAIKAYEKYIKTVTEDEGLKQVYIEVANCYFLDKKKDVAVKYIKKAILKCGFTEEEFIYNNVLNEDLSKYALSVLYEDLEKMQHKYLATLE